MLAFKSGTLCCALIAGLGTAAITSNVHAVVPVGTTAADPPAGNLSLKRRIAIGRFSNATNYGRALLLPGERDPIAAQVGDMLAARLVETQRFIVLERRDYGAVSKEQRPGDMAVEVPADTVLVGSVTQFGRKFEGNSGFLNSKARQVATATVEVRLVDPHTGQSFFSTEGTGSAQVEVKEVAGFGSQAAYDSSLNDKAISAAVSDLMTNLVQKLQERIWSTDVLQATGPDLIISGGRGEGLRVGERLTVSKRGPTVISRQSGMPIELPSEKIAEIEVTGFFGGGDAEGSTAKVVSGALGTDLNQLVVTSNR